MVSRFTKGKPWYDLIAFFLVVIVVCVIIQKAAPGSGLATAIHTAWHALAIGLQWIAGGLNALAGILDQL